MIISLLTQDPTTQKLITATIAAVTAFALLVCAIVYRLRAKGSLSPVKIFVYWTAIEAASAYFLFSSGYDPSSQFFVFGYIGLMVLSMVTALGMSIVGVAAMLSQSGVIRKAFTYTGYLTLVMSTVNTAALIGYLTFKPRVEGLAAFFNGLATVAQIILAGALALFVISVIVLLISRLTGRKTTKQSQPSYDV